MAGRVGVEPVGGREVAEGVELVTGELVEGRVPGTLVAPPALEAVVLTDGAVVAPGAALPPPPQPARAKPTDTSRAVRPHRHDLIRQR